MKFSDTEKRWLLEDPDITRQHIYNWEHGGGISMRFLPSVAKVRGITTDELIAQLLQEAKEADLPLGDGQLG
jgi:hypothetical protein